MFLSRGRIVEWFNPFATSLIQSGRRRTSNKLYNYLSDYYDKMNLNYACYSKLMFFDNNNVSKSYLIDTMLQNRYYDNTADRSGDEESDTYKTRVTTKFYKRAENKVEWLILDLAEDSIQKSFTTCSSRRSALVIRSRTQMVPTTAYYCTAYFAANCLRSRKLQDQRT